MPHIICAPCIDVMDKACLEVCPTEAIHLPDDTNLAEGDRKNMLYINPDECSDCGACAAECPVEAIFPEEDVPEEYEADTQRNADYFIEGPGYWDYDLDEERA